MSPLSVMLQETVRRDIEARTILALLRNRMDSLDHERRRNTRSVTLKERLGFKGLGCCGPTLGFRPTTNSVHDDDHHDDEDVEVELQRQREEEEEIEIINAAVAHEVQPGRTSDTGCLGMSPNAGSNSGGMNLAAALAAERQFRDREGAGINANVNVNNDNATAPATPSRMSLMRLLEETECRDEHGVGGRETEGGVGNDTICCVCMVRKKGAAFIPCGHTFCRVCTRELWLNRGSCPLCNRSILEILDIF